VAERCFLGGEMRYLTAFDRLTLADPAGKAWYADRADAYPRRLGALDAAIKAMCAPIPRDQRRIVTSHEAFNYFADAYDVDFLAAQAQLSHFTPARSTKCR
jgi:zinc/manganese transport system substrate-binding protein